MLEELSKYMGIGRVKAAALINAGAQTREDLKLKVYAGMLPKSTRAFIKYNPLEKIPRVTIDRFNRKIKQISLRIGVHAEILGSYARGAKESSDIDILIVGTVLEYKKFIEHIKPVLYHDSNEISNGIIKLNREFVKIDLFRCNPRHIVPYRLYLTGSGLFNIRMRAQAKRMGFVLNQKGLFKNKKIIPLNTERDYFNKLSMLYVEPSKRF
jgi:DNA polymerase/3'-5' exonuclease PolX